MTAVLELSSVTFAYGHEAVLQRLDLRVNAAQVLALLGPSGSGKSTVLRLLLGFEPPTDGQIALGGTIVSEPSHIVVPPEERNLGVVFQDLALWPHLTVRANLAFGLEARGVPRAERERRIRNALAELELSDKAERYPGALSGGEQQRAAIARALVLEPRAILMDEPLTNLDPRLKQQLLRTFRALFAERRTTVLYVTHDLREAAALTDQAAVLEQGRIVQQGTLADLRRAPATPFVEAAVADLTWTGRS